MEINRIISEIDSEIQMLQQVKSLLERTAVGRGRSPLTKDVGAKKKRVLSPEARAKIAAAQKARWAKAKKAAK